MLFIKIRVFNLDEYYGDTFSSHVLYRERRTRYYWLNWVSSGTRACLLYLDYDHVSISIDKKEAAATVSSLLQPSAVLHCITKENNKGSRLEGRSSQSIQNTVATCLWIHLPIIFLGSSKSKNISFTHNVTKNWLSTIKIEKLGSKVGPLKVFCSIKTLKLSKTK